MSNFGAQEDSGVATIQPPRSKRKNRPQPPKRLPPYAVIVLNDDDHTVDYVVNILQKVFGYDLEKCVKFAWTVHQEGRAIVWSGHKELAELKRDLIKSGGPDMFAKKPVKYPLGCLIEPLPQ